jgi:SAM-dependent methyltransferase
LAYALGITPWERAGEEGAQSLHRLVEREEAELGGPGRALDLGCGSGAHAVAMAERGWDVTGVDQIAKAIRRATARARSAGVAVRFVQGDVTRLDPATVGRDHQLFLDVGCFHGLDDEQRSAMGRCVEHIAAPEATLLMLAFRPGGAPKPLPRGADEAAIERAFPGWKVIDKEFAPTEGMPAPLRKAAPAWLRVRRVG